MNGFTKLSACLLDSTIWREDDKTRILWITMLAMAGREGIVEASIPGLADRARITVAEAETALAKLLAPDPYSRTKEYDGRRIEEVDGGWLLLNHAKYREALSTEERREYQRLWQQRKRKASTGVNRVQQSTVLTHAEAEAEAEANTYSKGVEWRGEERCYRKETRLVLAYLNDKSGKHHREVASNLDLIDARLSEDGVTLDGVKKMLDRQCSRWKNTPQWEFFRPTTLFDAAKFDAYYASKDESLPPTDSRQAAKMADAKKFVENQFK